VRCSADGGARLRDLAPAGPDFSDLEVPELKADKGKDQRLLLHNGRCLAVDSAKRVYWHDGLRANYRCTLPLTGHLDLVAAAYGDQMLATASHDERNRWGRPAKVQFWNASTGSQIGPTLVHPDTVLTLALSSDGNTLATSCLDGNVRFWKLGSDAPAGPTLRHLPQVWNFPVAFSPDGSLVVTGCVDKVRLWDRSTGELLHAFPHPRGVTAVAVVGRLLLVGGGATARLWDLATKKPVGQALMHPTDVSVVAFSPDGQVAATGASGTVQLWESFTALPLGPPLPCPRGTHALAFSPDREAILVSHNIGYRLFPLKGPVPDDARRLVLSAQVLTGLELDEGGAVQILRPADWDGRRRQLEEAGGSLLP
jgi:WD40 repeat protein